MISLIRTGSAVDAVSEPVSADPEVSSSAGLVVRRSGSPQARRVSQANRRGIDDIERLLRTGYVPPDPVARPAGDRAGSGVTPGVGATVDTTPS